MRSAKVFEKEWLTQQADKAFTLDKESLVRRIRRDKVEIKVGKCISRIVGVGTAQKRSHNTVIRLAGRHKPVYDILMVRWQVHFV
jgi:hypothetical protein